MLTLACACLADAVLAQYSAPNDRIAFEERTDAWRKELHENIGVAPAEWSEAWRPPYPPHHLLGDTETVQTRTAYIHDAAASVVDMRAQAVSVGLERLQEVLPRCVSAEQACYALDAIKTFLMTGDNFAQIDAASLLRKVRRAPPDGYRPCTRLHCPGGRRAAARVAAGWPPDVAAVAAPVAGRGRRRRRLGSRRRRRRCRCCRRRRRCLAPPSPASRPSDLPRCSRVGGLLPTPLSPPLALAACPPHLSRGRLASALRR